MRRRSLWIAAVAVVAIAAQASAAEPRTVRGSVAVPCRLYIEDQNGQAFFARSNNPHGSAVIYDRKRSEISREQHTELTSGTFVADLPPGKYTFTAEHGKEHTPQELQVEVPESGDVPDVKLQLVRWIDMAADHWYSGDTHVHRKLEELPTAIQAEDLRVVLPLTYWVRGAYEAPADKPVAQHPEPTPIVVTTPARMDAPSVERIIWPINTEYELFTVAGKPHTEGAVFVLNHRRPLTAAAPPVVPVAQAARDQGALLDLDKHSWNWSMMIVPLMQVDLFELANNHVWRTEFAFKNWTVEMLPRDWEIETAGDGYTERGWIDWGFKNYYALLNCGFRMRPTGGTASGVHPVPLGFGRVYVECPDGFSYENWMAGLNAGRSFVTTGPMLRVKFDGQPPGKVFADAKPHAVRVAGATDSLRLMQRIEIVVNGDVVRMIEPQNRQPEGTGKAGYRSTFDEQISIERSSWVAVRCFESRESTAASGERFYYAHTAPVHFEIDGPVRPKRREVDYFIQRMEQEIKRNQGVLAPAEIAEYERARDIYRKIAERAE